MNLQKKGRKTTFPSPALPEACRRSTVPGRPCRRLHNPARPRSERLPDEIAEGKDPLLRAMMITAGAGRDTEEDNLFLGK